MKYRVSGRVRVPAGHCLQRSELATTTIYYYCTPPPCSTLQWSGGLRDPGGLICCYNGCHPPGGHCSSFMTIIIIIGIIAFIIINIFFIVTTIIINIFIFTRQIVKGFQDWVKSLYPWWWLFKVVCASWFLRLWACLGHVEGNSMKRFTIWESSSTPHFALLPFCILCFVFRILHFAFCILHFAFCILHFAFCVWRFAFCI